MQLYTADSDLVRGELIAGIQSTQAYTSPKYLYDALGSALFEAITKIPEYYPTRTEAAIMGSHALAIARQVPKGSTFIDLGAGNCAKAASLFDLFCPRRYVAIDISVEFLKGALECLQRQYPALEMTGVGMDFSTELALPTALGIDPQDPVLLFYPGSSIGNFTPDAALNFLSQARTACGQAAGSGLLIGVDLVKPTALLEAAYDDALGVTAAFNKNLLLHINTLAGTDFNVADWSHIGVFNQVQSRIEMHLQANHDLTVTWPATGGATTPNVRPFKAGERIHTENSYKWTDADFTTLLNRAGFAKTTLWTDPQHHFAVVWAQIQ